VARRLGEPDIARDHGREGLLGEVAAHFVLDLARQVVARVGHREQHALEREARIQLAAHELDRFEQAGQTFERVVLALQRDDHGVCRRQGVECEQPERGRAVDQHDLVGVADLGERALEPALAIDRGHELDLGAVEIATRRDQMQITQLGGARHRFHDAMPAQRVIYVRLGAARAVCAGRVGLGVEVDQQGGALGGSQARGEIHGGRRLPDAALLIDDRVDPPRMGHLALTPRAGSPRPSRQPPPWGNRRFLLISQVDAAVQAEKLALARPRETHQYFQLFSRSPAAG
jgi:hypothetical protein